MRLFVALDIDAAIRERVATFRDDMRVLAPGVRWVGPETFHVTLQFLGETQKVEEIKRVLTQAKAAPVSLTFRAAGFFPTPQRARVFWVGIESGTELQVLVENIGTVLAPLGFKRDEEPYHPHLTLARAGSGRAHHKPGDKSAPGLQTVRAKLEAQPQPEFGTMTAHEFILYQSTLTPSGSHYTKLATFPLG
jgi:2'-5' RNA ligase